VPDFRVAGRALLVLRVLGAGPALALRAACRGRYTWTLNDWALSSAALATWPGSLW